MIPFYHLQENHLKRESEQMRSTRDSDFLDDSTKGYLREKDFPEVQQPPQT